MKRWPTKPLSDVLEVSRERIQPLEYPNTSFNYVGLENVEGHTGKLLPYQPTPGGEIKSTKNIFRPGQILFGKLRPYLNKVHLAREKGICSTDIYVLNPRQHQMYAAFASYFLRSPVVLATVSNVMAGANLPRINEESLLEIPAPVPPLAEQERIVKLLDEADELRKLCAKADHRTADLIPAVFHEMFGRADFVEKTIGQFLEQGWLLLHKDGNHGSLYPRSNDFGVEGIPFLSATCITDEGTIDQSEVKRLAQEKAKLLRHGWIECGDVLLAHNASVGAVGFYDGDYDRAIIGTSLTAFRANPDRIEPRFLWASLRDVFFQDQLERIMKQALRNQVPITAQRELFLRIPALVLQKEFAVRVSEIRALQAEQAASRRRLDDLFQSMLHRAFKGEL